LAAIYGDAVSTAPGEVRVRVSTAGGGTAVVSLSLPSEYPAASPHVSVEGLPKGDSVRKKDMMDRVAAALSSRRGEAVLFDVVEIVRDVFGADPAADAGDDAALPPGGEAPGIGSAPMTASEELAHLSITVASGAPFTVSKSTFQGHVARVTSMEGVAAVMRFLLAFPHIARGQSGGGGGCHGALDSLPPPPAPHPAPQRRTTLWRIALWTPPRVGATRTTMTTARTRPAGDWHTCWSSCALITCWWSCRGGSAACCWALLASSTLTTPHGWSLRLRHGTAAAVDLQPLAQALPLAGDTVGGPGHCLLQHGRRRPRSIAPCGGAPRARRCCRRPS
jgi:hypothetical protein